MFQELLTTLGQLLPAMAVLIIIAIAIAVIGSNRR